MSKLGFDRRLVDNRPHLHDLLFPEFVEHVLGKRNPLPVYIEAEKFSLRRTVEGEPARDIGRIGDQKLNVEAEVRDFIKIPLQHLAMARQSDWPAVVDRVIIDELSKPRPVLPVEAGDVAAVDGGEVVVTADRITELRMKRGIPWLSLWSESGRAPRSPDHAPLCRESGGR